MQTCITYANCINNITNLVKISEFAPRYLKHISFGKHFNEVWDKNVLPITVETLTFHQKSKFNYNLTSKNLPQFLKKIQFGSMFDKPIDNLPASIESIIFCTNSRFTRFIKKYPQNLKEIHFGTFYKKPIINIPSSVKYIYFSNKSQFNEIIEYPANLEKIFYGNTFNKSIDDLLTACKKINYIKFHKGSAFNHEINNSSMSLMHIQFGVSFNQEINFAGFVTLSTIRFYTKSHFNNQIHLPPNLECLYLGKFFNCDLDVRHCKKIQLIKFHSISRFKSEIIS
jgi:hypothetical protein